MRNQFSLVPAGLVLALAGMIGSILGCSNDDALPAINQLESHSESPQSTSAGSAETRALYSSPESVFEHAVSTQRDSDHRSLVGCFDRASVRRLNILLVLEIHEMLVRLNAATVTPNQQEMITSLEDVFQTIHVDSAAIQKISAQRLNEINTSNLEAIATKLSAIVQDDEAALTTLLGAVEKNRFPSRVLPRFSGKISEVQINGDEAAGNISGGNGPPARFEFVREGDGWRIRIGTIPGGSAPPSAPPPTGS
ncbi:MAG: hypothetical protein R3C03_23115 [Pirellulaceae bacterium]